MYINSINNLLLNLRARLGWAGLAWARLGLAWLCLYWLGWA
jgi:hypothetical protein